MVYDNDLEIPVGTVVDNFTVTDLEYDDDGVSWSRYFIDPVTG
jgi:hypothetical protein